MFVQRNVASTTNKISALSVVLKQSLAQINVTPLGERKLNIVTRTNTLKLRTFKYLLTCDTFTISTIIIAKQSLFGCLSYRNSVDFHLGLEPTG